MYYLMSIRTTLGVVRTFIRVIPKVMGLKDFIPDRKPRYTAWLCYPGRIEEWMELAIGDAEDVMTGG